MKNLKKLISVIIAVIMLVGSFATVSAADYADVESTDSYYKAIKVLSGLGIAKGDDEGNFNPENDVKRSEMVAFVCRMMGEEDIATASASNAFTDVAANHWAAGYIAWGVNRGVVNGMGDGTFAPDASVTYQDAVVMIMRALGYDRIAKRAENGGYPTGYLKLASQYGVLKDAGYDNAKAATREIIAQLIYNGLTAPLVDVSYYGVSVEDDRYVIYNGKNGTDLRTLLTYSNDVLKVKATIDETPKANPATCIDKEGNYLVKLTVTDAYDYSLAAVTTELGSNPAYVYVGETEAADLLGSTVEAYIAESEELNDLVLLAVVADSKSVVEETITENLNTIVKAGNVIKYYADMDDRKMTEIDITAAPTVYYNGVVLSSSDLATYFTDLETLLNANADSITFMGAKNEAYDKIFVTDYIYKVVKSVNEAESLIKFDPAGALDLDAESRNDEDFIYGIYDANGKAMDIADIEEGDVLNIVCPVDGGIGNIDTVDYLDIFVTSETVTGKVDEYRTTTSEYVIDGEAYTTTVGLTIGEEGVFYLSIDGKIIKKDAATAISKNFALYLGSHNEPSFDVNAYTFKLFTAEGEVNLKVADTLKVYAADGTASVKKAKDGAQDSFVASLNALIANQATESAAEANAKARFFSYATNADGEIKEIRLAGSASSELIAAIDRPAARYDADFEEFGGYAIADANLFVAPVVKVATATACDQACVGDHVAGCAYVAADAWNIDTDKLALGNFASLDEDDTFNSYLYTVNGEDDLVAVLMTDRPSYGLETSPLAVVASIGTSLDADDNAVYSYTIVQSGEVKTVKADYDEFPSGISGLAVGDIFQYAVNADDEIAEAKEIYNAATRALTGYASGLTVNNDDHAFVFGAIAEYSDYIVLMNDTDYVACDTACDAVDPTTCDHSACAIATCDHSACAYNAGTGVAADGGSIKVRINEVEGATYAWYEEALANNKVKKITINGVRETVRANAVYAAVGFVNENEKIEDIVVIALNPSAFNSWDDIDNFGNWKLTY